jgi:hypothetical protein
MATKQEAAGTLELSYLKEKHMPFMKSLLGAIRSILAG